MNERFPRVGVIGAGQLARMMVAPATALGIDLILFAQSSKDSGAQITHHVVGDYTNLEELKKFSAQCDVVTFEHELVPLPVIKGLEAAGVKVYPPSSAFIYSHDKAEMRKNLNSYPAPTGRLLHHHQMLRATQLLRRQYLVDMTGAAYGRYIHTNSWLKFLRQHHDFS